MTRLKTRISGKAPMWPPSLFAFVCVTSKRPVANRQNRFYISCLVRSMDCGSQPLASDDQNEWRSRKGSRTSARIRHKQKGCVVTYLGISGRWEVRCTWARREEVGGKDKVSPIMLSTPMYTGA